MRRPSQLEITRFWSHVDFHGPTVRNELGACWLWTGTQLRGNRHGQFHYAGKTTYTHRFAWMLAHGDPGSEHTRHACDVMNCVRVSHLSLGSQADNLRDMRQRNRQNDTIKVRGEKHWGARLTEVVVRECRRRYYGGETATALAHEYGVRNTTMSAAVTGRTWKHL